MSTAVGSRFDPYAIERDVLLASLSPDLRRFELLVRTNAPSLDWHWILDRAGIHRVTALLASSVASASLAAALPSDPVVELDRVRRRMTRLDHSAAHVIPLITYTLDAAGVRFLMLKGRLLSDHVYRDPGRRYFRHIDLLIGREQIAAAVLALSQLGYRTAEGIRPSRMAAGREPRSFEWRDRLRLPENDLLIVSHADSEMLPVRIRDGFGPTLKPRLHLADLESFTTATVAAGTFLRTLDREATIVHLALQVLGATPWMFRLVRLCDFAWAIERNRPDPDRLAALAQAWGASAELGRALALVDRLLGIHPVRDLHLHPMRIPRRWWFDRVLTRRSLVDRTGLRRADPIQPPIRPLIWAMAAGTLADSSLERVNLWLRQNWPSPPAREKERPA